MVEAFAHQGAQVIILDIQSSPGSELVQKLADANVAHTPVYYDCDVSNVDGAVRPTAAKILERFSRIHVLINNAANDVRQLTPDVTLEQWDTSIAVNLRHQFFLTQSLLPGLLEAKSSSVINMGSISWVIPGRKVAPYNACKAGTAGLTKSLAHEFGPKGVRVNSIMPGAIATERQKREIITPEYEALILDRQALKRLLQPEEVARLALWLAADDSLGVTNQSIVIDAGWI